MNKILRGTVSFVVAGSLMSVVACAGPEVVDEAEAETTETSEDAVQAVAFPGGGGGISPLRGCHTRFEWENAVRSYCAGGVPRLISQGAVCDPPYGTRQLLATYANARYLCYKKVTAH